MKSEQIFLPHSGARASFPIEDLLNEFQARKADFMIIGAQQSSLKSHTKPDSLDFWLRNRPLVKSRDTMQASKKVQNDIIKTGYFNLTKKKCPITGANCCAIAIKKN